MDNIIVFVYGTLLAGFGNHHRISDDKSSKFLGKDTIKGAMYGDGIPIIDVRAEGIIHGELYQVSPRVLKKLDALEGYYPGEEKSSGYVRIKVTTHKGVDTFVYAMTVKDSERSNYYQGRHIKSGNYRLWREKRMGHHGW